MRVREKEENTKCAHSAELRRRTARFIHQTPPGKRTTHIHTRLRDLGLPRSCTIILIGIFILEEL